MPWKYAAGIVLFFLLTNCAQMVPPNGGSKDEGAPKVIGTKPANKTVNFNGDKIIIKFDEYVQLKNPEQIIMSPYLADKVIEEIGKTIEISFPKTKPLPNTTYTINFGNSILDKHEAKNSLENYSYTFSTGPVLDSNKISGIISEAFNKKMEVGLIAGIYNRQKFNDSTLSKTRPDYFAKTNEEGKFIIENLPADSFYIYAFKDENKDLKYTKNEEIGFINNAIFTKNTEGLKIYLFNPPRYDNNLLLDTFSKQKGTFNFIVYQPSDIQIKPVGTNKYYSKTNIGIDQKDTIIVYIPNKFDSLQTNFIVHTADTNYEIGIKTRNKAKAMPFKLQLKSNNIGLSDSLTIQSSTPTEEINISKVMLLEDSIPMKIKYFRQITNFEWQLYYPFKEKTNYSILVNDSQFKDVFGAYNPQLKQDFQTKSSKDYGNLILSILKNKGNPLLIQLVEDNAQEKVIKSYSCKGCNELLFENISPVVVRIKVILDENGNGKWDAGNIKTMQQPERVYYHSQPITIKAYWDIEHTIEIEELLKH